MTIRFEAVPGILEPAARTPDAGLDAVLALPRDATAAVLGAPGSGKTTALVELLAHRVESGALTADEVLVLAPSRAAATRLRDAVALRLGVATNGPRVRTVPSLAFEIVTRAARRAGTPAPRLITGGEQDADIGDLLDGHIDDDRGPRWPDLLTPQVRRLRVFRTELRELLARTVERGLGPGDLARLGRETGRPEWEAAAAFLAEYLDVVAESRPSQLDSAELARFAERAIRDGEAGERIDALRLVLVDDLQEAPESSMAVLRALAARGVPIVAAGDPDVAANAFRGGEPDALGRLAAQLGVAEVARIVLPVVHRGGPALRALVAAVTGRIGAAAAGEQRRAAASGDDPDDPARPAVARIEAVSAAREAAAIARVLREEHLFSGVPWRRLAVIVRSGAIVPGIARALALAEVPTRSSSGGVALRDDQTARALLTLVDIGIGRSPLTPEAASELLLGPFGGLDALQLRRLRRALRAEEIAGGGIRQSGELLVEALGAPGRLATVDSRGARRAARLAETLDPLRTSGGSIEDLLWLVWERSGLADAWRAQALGSGLGAAEANRRLDGLVALFTAAKRFAERRPDVPATEFLAEVLDAEVPEDTLSPRSSDDAVLVTTPSGAVGAEFTTVVVARLQDGSWPNLRPRGSLLAPQELAAALAGGDTAVDRRKAVLDDELRMFALAVSRATERVVLSAVANDDETPSVLLRLVGKLPLLEASRVDRMPLSLRATVGRLRRIAAGRDPGAARLREPAVATLAALRAAGIPGADPAQWHGLVPVSTEAPLFEGERVPVSPSGMEKLEESPLDWFLQRVASEDSGVIANVGTIVHWAMETVEDPTAEALRAAVDARWPELVFDAPWVGIRQRALAETFTRALADYLAAFASDGKELVAAEGRFRLEVGDADVNGSIDRVELDAEGRVVIVDLKTGTPLTSPAKIASNAQLGAYQLAYAEGALDEDLAAHGADDHRAGGAKLLYVKSGVGGQRYREAEQPPADAAALDVVRERIGTAARLIAAAEFDGLVELEQWGRPGNARLRLVRVRGVSSD